MLLCFCRFQPNSDITGMMSVEGELVPFKTRIKPSEANGAVEKWLVQVRSSRVTAQPSYQCAVLQ
jgi:hypothetical protein